MMEICDCGKEFLTECDPYAILPKPSGYETNCGCFFEKQERNDVERFKIYEKGVRDGREQAQREMLKEFEDSVKKHGYGAVSHLKQKYDTSKEGEK